MVPSYPEKVLLSSVSVHLEHDCAISFACAFREIHFSCAGARGTRGRGEREVPVTNEQSRHRIRLHIIKVQ